MSRLFWLGLGVAAGVFVTRKATETARQLTPAGAAANVGDALRELASAVGAFGAEVRVGMSEREQELHAMVADRTGIDAGRAARRALPPSGDYSWTPSPRRDIGGVERRARRARRAGG